MIWLLQMATDWAKREDRIRAAMRDTQANQVIRALPEQARCSALDVVEAVMDDAQLSFSKYGDVLLKVSEEIAICWTKMRVASRRMQFLSSVVEPKSFCR